MKLFFILFEPIVCSESKKNSCCKKASIDFGGKFEFMLPFLCWNQIFLWYSLCLLIKKTRFNLKNFITQGTLCFIKRFSSFFPLEQNLSLSSCILAEDDIFFVSRRIFKRRFFLILCLKRVLQFFCIPNFLKVI